MGRARLLLTVGCAGAVLAGVLPAAAGPGAAAAPQLPWLSVAHPAGARAQIVDPAGRTVILRGVNLVGLEDDVYAHPTGDPPRPGSFWPIDPAAYAGRCPVNSHQISEPPVCEVQAGRPEFAQQPVPGDDLAQIRSLGLNVVRLPVNWSQLEPTPGSYNTTYLDRIAQVVGWAREQGIYVLLDLHQDNYSRFTPETAATSVPPLLTPTTESGGHADGAPPWAVLTDGEPALAVGGQGELNAYVAAAFTSFWANRVPTDAAGTPLPQGQAPGPGLQDHYIGAVAALARRFAADSTVVGYELMNEPLPGYAAVPGGFDQGLLFPFYRRVIDAITGVGDGIPCPLGQPYAPACGYPDLGIHDTRHLVFVEPMAARNLSDVALGVSAPFTSYPNLVYAPHAYTHVFTADTEVPGGVAGQVFPPSYDFAFQTADAEARAIGAALWIGEYGNANADDPRILASETAAQDRAMVGSALWAWKGNCGEGQSAAACWPGLWSVYYGDTADPPAQNGPIIPSRLRYLARVYPRATAGVLTGYAYDPTTGTFTMTASSASPVRPGDRDRETVVYLPAGVTGAVRVSGAAVLDRVRSQPDGSRLAFVAPTGAGGYGVSVG